MKFIPGFSFANFFVLLRLENLLRRAIHWTSERHQNVKRMLYSTSLTFKSCVKSRTCDCMLPILKHILFHYFYISGNIPAGFFKYDTNSKLYAKCFLLSFQEFSFESNLLF